MSKYFNGSWTLTNEARLTLRVAGKRAYQYFHEFVQPIHVLLGLLESGGSANAILLHLGHEPQRLFKDVVSICREMPFEYYVIMGVLPQTREVKAILDRSLIERCRRNSSTVTTSDLLLGIVSTDNPARDLLHKARLDFAYIMDHLWVVEDAICFEADGQACELGSNAVC